MKYLSYSILILALLIANVGLSQTILSDQNYVHTTTPQQPVTIEKLGQVGGANEPAEKRHIEEVTYFDGLGRPMQSVGIKQSPNSKDIITHIEYDALGRQAKQHLPFERDIFSGVYRPVDVNGQINAYYLNKYQDDFPGITDLNQVNAYSESVYEASPLNRVKQQAAPGSAWKAGNGHEIKFEYDLNEANEVHLFEVAFTNGDIEQPSITGGTTFYAEGQLNKTITYDENHTTGKDHSTEEFKDKLGRVVLKRTYASTSSVSSEPHDTYYVYDDFGNLTYVLPPKVDVSDGVSQVELDELGYQYRYDQRNRLIEKKIPGKGRESIVYNTLDQPILTQDAIQKVESAWLFMVYDAFGRIAYTGLDSANSSDRATLQTAANITGTQFVTKTTVANTYTGTPVYYTKNAYPTSFDKVFTINYYDNYTFDKASLSLPATNSFGQGIINHNNSTPLHTKGLTTGTKVRVLETNAWITTITGYDQKRRAIYIASKNEYLQTTDILEHELDFTGKVKRTKTIHTKGTNIPIVTIDVFTYDHVGRLLTQTQTINDQNPERIVANSYDVVGQLGTKRIGGNGIISLQKVDYDYNIRGWLTSINKGTTANGDLFGFKINYNTPQHGATALFNGNISETSWQTANDNINRHYTYSYDALNRITGAISNSGKYNLSGVTYDKNGNILSLDRKGHLNDAASTFGDMDKLIYHYDHGNRLLKVTDTAHKTYGFKDGTNINDDFEYDANGNMKIDRNKGITDIAYNHLNLPTTVAIANTEHTGNISYIYDATGTKLKKIVTEGSSFTTEYAGNYVYKNGELEFFNQPEGYVEKDDTGYKYVYQYKDHLGNVRLSYTDADNNGTIAKSEIIEEKNYYPFGLEHKGYNNILRGAENNHQTYLGKEISKELGLNWLSFRHRNYMPEIGRFFGVDPVAGDYVTISPYQFAHNNPVWKIELEGLEGQELNGFDVVNAPPSGQSGKNPAAHLPLPVGDQSSGTSSGNKSTRKLVAIQKRVITGYPGQALDEAVTAGVQYLGSKLSGSNVSKSTSENIQLGTNMLMLLFSKGKNGKAGAEVFEQLTKTASTKSLSKIALNTSKLSGAGSDVLEGVIKKTNNIGTHLSPSDLKGAVKDILGGPVTINGKAFDHIGEVTDALKGLGKQITKLNKGIKNGSFSDEVLDAATSLRTQLQSQKDQIQNVLNNARQEASGF